MFYIITTEPEVCFLNKTQSEKNIINFINMWLVLKDILQLLPHQNKILMGQKLQDYSLSAIWMAALVRFPYTYTWAACRHAKQTKYYGIRLDLYTIFIINFQKMYCKLQVKRANNFSDVIINKLLIVITLWLINKLSRITQLSDKKEKWWQTNRIQKITHTVHITHELLFKNNVSRIFLTGFKTFDRGRILNY